MSNKVFDKKHDHPLGGTALTPYGQGLMNGLTWAFVVIVVVATVATW